MMSPSHVVCFLFHTYSNVVNRLYRPRNVKDTSPTGQYVVYPWQSAAQEYEKTSTQTIGAKKSTGGSAGKPLSLDAILLSSKFIETLIDLLADDESELKVVQLEDMQNMFEMASIVLQTTCQSRTKQKSTTALERPGLTGWLLTRLITCSLVKLLIAVETGHVTESDLTLAMSSGPDVNSGTHSDGSESIAAAAAAAKQGNSKTSHARCKQRSSDSKLSLNSVPPNVDDTTTSAAHEMRMEVRTRLQRQVQWITSNTLQSLDGVNDDVVIVHEGLTAAAELFVHHVINDFTRNSLRHSIATKREKANSENRQQKVRLPKQQRKVLVKTAPEKDVMIIKYPVRPPTEKYYNCESFKRRNVRKSRKNVVVKKPEETNDDDELAVYQSSFALRTRNSIELSRERFERTSRHRQLQLPTNSGKLVEEMVSERGSRLLTLKDHYVVSSSDTTQNFQSGNDVKDVRVRISKYFSVYIPGDALDAGTVEKVKSEQDARMAEESPTKAGTDIAEKRDTDRQTLPDLVPQHPYENVVPTLSGRPIDSVDPELIGDALGIISLKNADDLIVQDPLEPNTISKRNSFRSLHRPDVSRLDWVQNKQEAVIEKVTSFHASRQSLLHKKTSPFGMSIREDSEEFEIVSHTPDGDDVIRKTGTVGGGPNSTSSQQRPESKTASQTASMSAAADRILEPPRFSATEQILKSAVDQLETIQVINVNGNDDDQPVKTVDTVLLVPTNSVN